MKILLGFGLVVLFAGSVCAQFRNPTPVLTGGFGNVVYPGGTTATLPGIQRFTPNVVYPAGGGPHLYVPFSSGSTSRPGGRRNNGTAVVPYAVPVYLGGYGYGSYFDGSYDPTAAQQPGQPAGSQQPNVTVVYPPQPAPVIINQFGSGAAQPAPAAEAPAHSLYVTPSDETENSPAPETTPYLIAFKDHSVYAAVAYWVDGDTLHYFTSGNTHNQVSLSLVDRELTERLNKESGRQVQLPPVK